MKSLTLLYLGLGVLASGLSSAAPVVRVAEIRSTINPATSNFLRASIQAAERERAQFVLVELDTPGGLVSSVREMAQIIESSKVPVVVYVAPAGASATSAGALLMLASHVSAMAPGTNIGAAHPVGSQGEDIKGSMGEKVTNDTAAFARGLAEVRGRNRDIAEKIVTKSVSLTAEEAKQQNFIDVLAATREELIKALDGRAIKLLSGSVTLSTQNAQVESSRMSFGQMLLNLLANPNIAAILMSLGMLLIYMELSHPGISIAGILGGICLVVAFMAFQTIPVRVGGVALLAVGICLMLAEPFVTAKGAVAAGGVLSFVLGLIWVVDPDRTDLSMSWKIVVPIALVMGGGIAAIGYAAARTIELSRETLKKIGGGAHAGLAGYHGVVEWVSDDHHHGRVKVRGEIWECRSDEPLVTGDSIRVSGVDGLKIKVHKVKAV